MAGIKHTYSTTIRNDAGAAVIADTTAITADAEENFKITVAASATVEIDLPLDVSTLVSFFVESSQDTALHTNAADGAGGQTFALTAGRALYWNNLLTGSNPLTIDVTTGLFFTNNGLVTATVKGGFLTEL